MTDQQPSRARPDFPIVAEAAVWNRLPLWEIVEAKQKPRTDRLSRLTLPQVRQGSSEPVLRVLVGCSSQLRLPSPWASRPARVAWSSTTGPAPGPV
jgi:hypothetical protein